MQVRRKTIGGQAHYDIVEVFQRGSRTEYSSVVALGTDPDPQVALAKHQAALVDITKTLLRLQHLQDSDATIGRKCNTLRTRLRAEQDRIGLLLDAIEKLEPTDEEHGEDAAAPSGPNEPNK